MKKNKKKVNNKTDKKKIKKRLNVKRFLVLLLAIFLFVMLFKEILKVDIENITVTGNHNVSDSAIIKASHLTEDSTYFSILPKKVCNEIKKNPFIDECKLKKKMDLNIEIRVTENKPILYYLNDTKLALSNGTLVDEKNVYGVPTLINYVPNKILKKFISGLSKIKSDIILSISEIEYSPSMNSENKFIDEERFTIIMNDGNTVYVNNRHIDVLNLYDKIFSSIGDKRGYYNLDCEYNNYFFEEYKD